MPGPKPVDLTLSTTSFATLFIVSVPVTSKVSPPVLFQDLLLKLMAGNLAESKKFADRKSSSRLGAFVVMLDVSMTASCWLVPE
jgi:hypothetical protein